MQAEANPQSSVAAPTAGAPEPRVDERRRTGFTLIEIMAVVLIMGMLMGLVGVAVFGQVEQARITTARAKMKQIEGALELYRMNHSRYPSTDQGLDALLSPPAGGPTVRNYPKGGYLGRADALDDPWGERFLYESPGQHNANSFDLWSLGADQAPGGSDADGDIGNWGSEGEG